MRTMLFIIAALTCGPMLAADPIEKVEENYAKQLKKINEDYQQKVSNLNKVAARKLESIKVSYTKAGDLEKALKAKAATERYAGEDVKTLLEVEKSVVSGKTFDFITGDRKIGTFTLAPGGKLTGYTHANETFWKVSDGYLHIIPSDKNRGSTKYRIAQAEEQLILVATHFLGSTRYVLGLYEVKK